MQHFIGCDVHTRNQVVAWIDEQTGEIGKRRLEHEGKEVKEFYAQFPRGTVVGIEATFPVYWFERLRGEPGLELWVGDAAPTRASEVRYQKNDHFDAELILDLLRTGRFPRIWVPSLKERDLRQLLVHRMKQVRARTQVKNQLQALAISQGVCRKRKLWSAKGRKELESLALLPWAARRQELLASLDRLDEQVRELDRVVAERPLPPGIIHHSDQGIQYVSADLVDHLLALGFQISMSRKAAPWENGYAESFIKTLKAEEVSLRRYRNLREARRSIGYFLDEVYNQRRLHSALGYLPPAQFERDRHEQSNKEAAARQLP